MRPESFELAIFLAIVTICSFAEATSAFGCKNSLISDEWRKKVLKFHNDNRKRLALGILVDSKGAQMPEAKAMQKLYWDCNMEDQAWQAVKDCPTSSITLGTYGVSEAIATPSGKCNVSTVTDSTLREWWNELKKNYDKATAQMKYKATEIPHFGVMAYSKSKGFACTYQPCGRNLHLICVYSENGANPNNKIYEEGTTCDDCQANKCVDSLCPDKPDPAKDLVPQCPQNADKMSNDLRTMALDMHNYYRRLLATGWAKDKLLGYAKTASKMPVLEYDCQLETDATTHTDTCPTAAEGGNMIENFWSGDYQLAKEVALQKAIENWWSPLEKIGVGKENTYEAGKGLESYAQMAYEEVTKIGCGVKTCQAKGNVVVDCRYNSRITPGDSIYTTGVPCKGGCGGKGCTPLGGLCKQ